MKPVSIYCPLLVTFIIKTFIACSSLLFTVEFIKWKEDDQRYAGNHYVKESAQKKLKEGAVDYYRCHRSYTANVTSGRRIKYLKSNKIDAACPSRLTVRRNGDEVTVDYTKTHFGHESDVGRDKIALAREYQYLDRYSSFYAML